MTRDRDTADKMTLAVADTCMDRMKYCEHILLRRKLDINVSALQHAKRLRPKVDGTTGSVAETVNRVYSCIFVGRMRHRQAERREGQSGQKRKFVCQAGLGRDEEEKLRGQRN